METKKVKLNVLLAKTDHLAGVFKKGLEDYIKFFKGSQGSFKGEKRTYEPNPGTIDMPKERDNKLVVTTVKEKLDYFEKSSTDYIDALFSQEKTNSSGTSKAKLICDGFVFGEFSSLELLRLKTLLEGGLLKEMYDNIPVRPDNEIWKKSSNELYFGREIYESTLQSGVHKTTTKEHYILQDPNVSKLDGTKYIPQVASKDTIVELGQYTLQRFSGESTHIDRSGILARRSKLLVAVIEALKEANDVEAVPSQMTADKLFNYLHNGE